jgi:hypothetical protein
MCPPFFVSICSPLVRSHRLRWLRTRGAGGEGLPRYDREDAPVIARAAPAVPVKAAVAVAAPGAVRLATNCIAAGFSACSRASAALDAQMN